MRSAIGSLAKYHARSPRYILHPDDNTVIRMAGPQQIPWEEGTEIKNISLTGLAFTVPSDICPSIGEFIKIQYAVPGSQQMACHALVTRLDDLSASKTLVAVKFYRMELSQRIILAQGLALKLRDQQSRFLDEQRRKLGWKAHLFSVVYFVLWALLFYFSSSWTWMQYLRTL